MVYYLSSKSDLSGINGVKSQRPQYDFMPGKLKSAKTEEVNTEVPLSFFQTTPYMYIPLTLC